MSQRTYFQRGNALFVSEDSNERTRLKRRGWTKVRREDAIDYCGGESKLRGVVARCGSGEVVVWPQRMGTRELVVTCRGHDASREPLR